MSVNVTSQRSASRPSLSTPNPLFLRDDELTRSVELLEAACRTLLAEPDRRLKALGLGRNHQRLIYFIGARPKITMAGLRGMVQLTKQSLSRLIKELEAKDLVTGETDRRDRRQRLLELTPEGRSLNEQLNARLRSRVASAYRAAGADAVAGYHRVLLGLIDERTRRRLQHVD